MALQFLERKQIANQLDLGIIHFNGLLSEPDCPRLESLGKIGNTFVYDPDAVAQWLPKFRLWREAGPALKAAKRAAEHEAWKRGQERLAAEIDARRGKPTPEQMVMEAHQQAYRDRAAELERLNSSKDYRL